MTNPSSLQLSKANKLLKKSARTLFGIAVLGQLLFAVHIISFYGSTTLKGTTEEWNNVMHNGLMPGDSMGNFALAAHLLLAAVITLGGPIQFIQSIRNRFPTFHRWNGRIYILTAFLMSLSGLYMVHTRGVLGGDVMAMGNTLNASLIIIFSYLTYRTAVNRDFVAHKKWALRAFLMVSGVWFIRIGFGLWIILNNFSAPGSTEALTGPFDRFLAFAQTFLPLALIELYFLTNQKASIIGRLV